ncbi:MAG: DUF547 domain-containing protein [Bacteroidia bacterium]|nr:DUF547 domain-containing protein [Bacteroidia bacterium]NNK55140.1 DUF547 domain-containing protein [Flavobacteriaceae bacterium]
MKKILAKIFLLIIALSFQQCTLFSAAGLTSQGQPTKLVTGSLTAVDISDEIVDHSVWDTLLKKHVDHKGQVDYAGFQQDQPVLRAYLEMLSNIQPAEKWSVEELLAYYINTYNAYTVQLILDNYPVRSIKDIGGPWTRGIVPIGDKNLSLGGIENGILRKMNEPRIHFAINCASISCPKLLNEAFTASKMEAQLERVTAEFINGEKNDLNATYPRLSSIFNWYKKDFVVNGKVDVIGYINSYSKTQIDPNASIEYKDYDWNLNVKQ